MPLNIYLPLVNQIYQNSKFFIFIVFTFCFYLTVYADTTWTGDINSDWLLASNWTNGVPGAGNNADIPDPSQYTYAPVISLPEFVVYEITNSGHLWIEATAFLDILSTHTITNYEQITLQGGAIFNVNNGTITNDGGTIENLGGTITNTKTFENKNGGFITNNGAGAIITCENGGGIINFVGATIENLAGAKIEIKDIDSDLFNSGSITNAGTNSILTAINEGSISNLIGATIENQAGAKIEIKDPLPSV